MSKAVIAARRKSRRLIVQALYQSQLVETDAVELIAQFLAHHDFEKADSEYFKESMRFILANVEECNALIESKSDIPPEQLDPVERGILWLAIFEFKERMDIPYVVVINEAVEQAKTFGADQSHKFVNATLDKLAADLRALEYKSKK